MKRTGKTRVFLTFVLLLSVITVFSAYALVPENREQSPVSVSGSPGSADNGSGIGNAVGNAARDAGRAAGDVIDGIGNALGDAVNGRSSGGMTGSDGISNGVVEDDNASNGVVDNDNVNGSAENGTSGSTTVNKDGGINPGIWLALLLAAAVVLLLLLRPKRSNEA